MGVLTWQRLVRRRQQHETAAQGLTWPPFVNGVHSRDHRAGLAGRDRDAARAVARTDVDQQRVDEVVVEDVVRDLDALVVTTGEVVPGGMGWGDPPMK